MTSTALKTSIEKASFIFPQYFSEQDCPSKCDSWGKRALHVGQLHLWVQEQAFSRRYTRSLRLSPAVRPNDGNTTLQRRFCAVLTSLAGYWLHTHVPVAVHECLPHVVLLKVIVEVQHSANKPALLHTKCTDMELQTPQLNILFLELPMSQPS